MQSFSFRRDPIQLRLEKRIESFLKGYRQNIGLIGPLGFGKTQFLSDLYRTLSLNPDFLVIYIQAQVLDYDQLLDRWIYGLFSSFFLNRNIPLSQDSQWLFTTAEPLIPKTVDKIRRLKKMIRRGEKNAASVRELFSLTGVLAEETGKKIILMIDEFQALENVPAPDPFVLLGKQIMLEKETLYLVASSQPKKAREIFHDKLSLLFGNFEVIELQPLGFDETADFLKLRCPGLLFSDSQKKFLIRMTDGIPTHLELLLDRIERIDSSNAFSAGTGPVEISNEQMLKAFYDELFDMKGRLSLIFEKRLETCRQFAKDSCPYLRALLAISNGRRKVLSIATYIEKTVRETDKMLQRLVQEEIVVKRGSFYVLEDPLFRFWLREVFERRNQLNSPDLTPLSQSLTHTLSEMLKQLELEEKWDVTARAEALFKEFRNDLVEVDQRKLRCPHFSEIAFRPSNGRLFPLLARKANLRWICQIARHPVHEEDITFFLDELKKYRRKIQRKILVTLDGIDQNARLMAQEAEIQLWDLRDFNALLDLYNQPKIILMKEWDGSNLGAVAQSVPTA